MGEAVLADAHYQLVELAADLGGPGAGSDRGDEVFAGLRGVGLEVGLVHGVTAWVFLLVKLALSPEYIA